MEVFRNDIVYVQKVLLHGETLLRCENGSVNSELARLLMEDLKRYRDIVDIDTGYERNPLKRMVKKIIRKYVLWAMKPVINRQTEFNKALFVYLNLHS